MKVFARWSVILLILSPLLALISKIESWHFPELAELETALAQTLIQSTASTIVVILLGLLGGLSLIGVKKHRWAHEMILLVPSFVPAIFIIVAVLQIFPSFPFGITGVVIAHVVTYSGLVAVMCAHLLENKIGAFSESAWVMGIEKKDFIVRIALPYLKKDLVLISLYVFTMCLSSFSIPLMLGGRGASTLELLVFEKLMIDYDVGSAVALGSLQLVFLFALSLLTRSEHAVVNQNRNLFNLSLKWTHAPLVLMTIAIVFVNLLGLTKGVRQITSLPSLQTYLYEGLLGSLLTLLFVSLGVMKVLYLIAIGWPNKKFEMFLEAFSSPSSTVIAMGIVSLLQFLPNQYVYIQALKITVGFLILVSCSLYRLRWSSTLEQVRGQVAVAQTLGASQSMIFKNILFPQLLPECLFLSGLSAFWVSGEFAISRLITGQDVTLSLVAKSLMSSYRLESATVVVWITLIFGFSSFLIFWRLSHVARKKLIA